MAPDAQVAVDGGADAVCTPRLRLSARFTIDRVGTGSPSNLDVLLGHANGFTLEFDRYQLVRGLDQVEVAFTTAVTSDDWSIDFSGVDGLLLEQEMGWRLTTGERFMHSIFDMQAAHPYSAGLYLLPDDPRTSPYLAVDCFDPGFDLDDNGFPRVESVTLANCQLTIFEPRGAMFKTLSSKFQNTSLAIEYQACP